jgi:hypothetical protein
MKQIYILYPRKVSDHPEATVGTGIGKPISFCIEYSELPLDLGYQIVGEPGAVPPMGLLLHTRPVRET